MAPASGTVYTGNGKENSSADTDYSTYYKIKTRAGKKAKQGRTIAVDKRKIKLGSKVQINGKTYVAEDVGGGVKGKHIDVFFKSHKQTKRFGKKTGVKVYKVN